MGRRLNSPLISLISVTKNGTTATGYNIVGTSGGLDADIPYTGGKVVFEVAPTALDAITIARNLPLTRQYDYQPTAKIDPTTLNQDLNYLIEVIKDRQDELETLATQYAEIADKESTTTLLARISAIHDEIVAVSAQITALGDISTLRTNVTTNTNDITTLKGYDYVIESQAPTADNNYTWYRKYKSGWVEQGGIWSGSMNCTPGYEVTVNITLPISMTNKKYYANAAVISEYLFAMGAIRNNASVQFRFGAYAGGTRQLTEFVWNTKGIIQ